ncbi:MAG: hypothetical protein H6845_00185 [Alphaproteobacteria bacterium]|nr:MAG: hypothetical protein H6845_00185 [Alphaproteobacteria bacterium]
MKRLYTLLELNLRLFKVLATSLLFVIFNIICIKEFSVLDHVVKLHSIRYNFKHTVKINNIITAYFSIKSINIDLQKWLITIKKLSIFNTYSDFQIKLAKIIKVKAKLINNKFDLDLNLDGSNVTCNLHNIKAKGIYHNKNLILHLDAGYLSYLNNNLFIKYDNAQYYLESKINFNKLLFERCNFFLKNKQLIVKLADNKWNLDLNTPSIKGNVVTNRELEGKGKLKTINKFNILNSELEFDITGNQNGLCIRNNSQKQLISIPAFKFAAYDIKYDFTINPYKQEIVLTSKNLELKSQFFFNELMFQFQIHTPKVDLKANGTLDYNENINIEGIGNYISLLDMKPLLKKSNNNLSAKFKWKKAKWIENLILDDMEIVLEKNKDGLSYCNIISSFENNSVKLWKKNLNDKLHFDVDNFARAFELMYGTKIIQSSYNLIGELDLSDPSMHWSFELYDFTNLNTINAIYTQLLSLRFWASILKNKHKHWNYLIGKGYISSRDYIIQSMEMENEFLKITGSGSVSRFNDYMNIDGELFTKSITTDLKNLLKQKSDPIKFNVSGSLKNPVTTNNIGIAKLAAPILPLALLLI